MAGRFEVTGIDPQPRGELAAAVWNRDGSAWGPGEDDPAERLGWLELPESMRSELEGLRSYGDALRDAGVRDVVLLGMGGSSLAPEVYAETFGPAPGRPRLIVADSTHPAQVSGLRAALDPRSTSFIVSSKSGTTAETMALYRYFRAWLDDGSRYVAVTDPGTPLEALAADEGFARVFTNPPDIGGRYSALSLFGLVPAAALGVDLAALLDAAAAEAAACGASVATDDNPGLVIGSTIGNAARAGRDKLTFLVSRRVASFGVWVEQLLAESTGKQDTGIVPVVEEPPVDPGRYGGDRIFAWVHDADEGGDADRVAQLKHAGHPVIESVVQGAYGLGAEMFRWEFATAVAGAILGINPFDQPNVEAAKAAARTALSSGDEPRWKTSDPAALFDGLAPPELGVVVAFAPRDAAHDEVLQGARRKLIAASGAATMRGFGPRYLHSTGQLHKGGPKAIRVLVALERPGSDEPIPGEDYGFARLVTAQAVGDARALHDAGRRVATCDWEALARWVAS